MRASRRHHAIPPAALSAAVVIAVILALGAVGCGSPAAPAPSTALPPATNTPVPAIATATSTTATTAAPAAIAVPMPTATAAASPAATAPSPMDTPAPLPPTDTPTDTPPAAAATDARRAVFTLGEGSVARYKVEEVLARTGFKVATGETADVDGQVVFDADGNVAAGESRIAVSVGTLRTDSDRRDGYVRNRTLETDTYPEVVFVPTAIGWANPATSAGELSGVQEFTIAGDLTVKDRTRPVVWDATAEFREDGTASGQASVEFTFADFGMTKPSVAIVLSVEDTIRLELDFVGQFAPQ